MQGRPAQLSHQFITDLVWSFDDPAGEGGRNHRFRAANQLKQIRVPELSRSDLSAMRPPLVWAPERLVPAPPPNRELSCPTGYETDCPDAVSQVD